MTTFIKTGDIVKPTSDENVTVSYSLPLGTYVVDQDEYENFFLKRVEDFKFSGKRYGDNIALTDRILNTFISRDKSTGVVMAGIKGSGKSLLAKTVSIQARQVHNIPTVIINQPFHGDRFNSFIQSITGYTIIIFDEFEKVYTERTEKERILTLLDGVFPSSKLFLITCNDASKINENLLNRPGRIFYFITFDSVSPTFIEEYCGEVLFEKHRHHIPRICILSRMFNNFTFDMLQGMVEEMNRYGETPDEVMNILNVTPRFNEPTRFNLHGVEITTGNKIDNIPHTWYGAPLKDDITYYDDNGELVMISPSDIVSVDEHSKVFVYECGNVRITATKIDTNNMDLDSFIKLVK